MAHILVGVRIEYTYAGLYSNLKSVRSLCSSELLVFMTLCKDNSNYFRFIC